MASLAQSLKTLQLSESSFSESPQTQTEAANSIQVLDQLTQLKAEPKPTQFSDLPIELRLKIWRLTFFKRHINFLSGRQSISQPIELGVSIKSPLPVAFSLNFESRKLAQKHYANLWKNKEIHDRSFIDFCKCHHAYLNFNLDSILIVFPNKPLEAAKLSRYVEFINKAHPEKFRLIEEVEIRDMPWELFVHDTLRDPLFQFSEFCVLLKLLKLFTGMKVLRLSFSADVAETAKESVVCLSKFCKKLKGTTYPNFPDPVIEATSF